MAYDYDPLLRAAYRSAHDDHELAAAQRRHPSQSARPADDDDRFRYDLARETHLADTLTDPPDPT